MVLRVRKSTRRNCPKCDSGNLFIETYTAIGETIEECEDCGNIEASPPAKFKRVIKHRGKYIYDYDPDGEWHYHGGGWHKARTKHRRKPDQIHDYEKWKKIKVGEVS